MQQTTHRPSVQLEWVPGRQAEKKVEVPVGFAFEASFSRSDRLLGDGDAELQVTHLWGGVHFWLRYIRDIWAVDLRVRWSMGPGRLVLHDFVSETSDDAWRLHSELGGLLGLRVWSCVVVQAGIMRQFAHGDFKDASSPALHQRNGVSGVVRVGIEYRFGEPELQRAKSQPAKLQPAILPKARSAFTLPTGSSVPRKFFGAQQ